MHRATRRGRWRLTLALFERWLDERELLVAKLELSLEAPRNPAVAEALTASRTRLVGVVDGLLSPAARERGDARAEALVASFDGLLIARPAEAATRTPGLPVRLARAGHARAQLARGVTAPTSRWNVFSPRLGPCLKP